MAVELPNLFIICGMPGSGKSEVALRIAEATQGIRLRTDELRRELIITPTYSPEEKLFIYKRLFEKGHDLLQAGKTVVFDGAFDREDRRREAIAVAAASNVKYAIFLVTVDDLVAAQRMGTRMNSADNVSDATPDIRQRLTAGFEPIVEPHFVIDNSGELVDLDIQVKVGLRKLGTIL